MILFQLQVLYPYIDYISNSLRHRAVQTLTPGTGFINYMQDGRCSICDWQEDGFIWPTGLSEAKNSCGKWRYVL